MNALKIDKATIADIKAGTIDATAMINTFKAGQNVSHGNGGERYTIRDGTIVKIVER